MKIYLTTILIFASFLCHSQDDQNEDSISFIKNYLVFNSSFLYNIYIGQKKIEGFKGSSGNEYSLSFPQNTCGYRLSIAQKHFFNKRFSMQNGLNITYKSERNNHQDSIKNSNNINLNYTRESLYVLNYSYYLNCNFKNVSIMSGVIIPLFIYVNGIYSYYDKSIIRWDNGFDIGLEHDHIFLSENIQFQLSRKYHLNLCTGIDFSTDIFFKNQNGYKILLNGGVVWLYEMKNKHRRIKDDYVK